MRLSTLVSESSRYTDRGVPIWLWHAARQRDLAWIRAEGLIWRPSVYLASTRKAAIGFHPGKDRLILRVSADHLDPDQLTRDAEWRSWVSSLRHASPAAPPAELVSYWARLRKFADPEGHTRLRQADPDPDQLRQDLRTQIARVRPEQLWRYATRVPPEALSLANEAGFYVSVRSLGSDGLGLTRQP